MTSVKAAPQDHKLDISGDARFVLIGGFLGAGKTSTIARITSILSAYGIRCALITNDQGGNLVDTESARSLPSNTEATWVEEITGGCFCCRLSELVESIDRMTEQERPALILAEPVGSCTDLVATVLKPLEQIYRRPLRLSPLTVLIDARRALEAFGGKKRNRSFNKDVGYIFQKQIEEAGILAINKCDLLTQDEKESIAREIISKHPNKPVHFVSAKTGEGYEEWLSEALDTNNNPLHSLEIDYEVYGRGEALLGWYNATLDFRTEAAVDADDLMLSLAQKIAAELIDFEMAHFKMALRDETERLLCVVNQVLSEDQPAVSKSSSRNLSQGSLLINLRAEADPEILASAVTRVIKSDPRLQFLEASAFRPGMPSPTHRLATM